MPELWECYGMQVLWMLWGESCVRWWQWERSPLKFGDSGVEPGLLALWGMVSRSRRTQLIPVFPVTENGKDEITFLHMSNAFMFFLWRTPLILLLSKICLCKVSPDEMNTSFRNAKSYHFISSTWQNYLNFCSFLFMYLCTHVCAYVPCVGTPEDYLWESVLSFAMRVLELKLRSSGLVACAFTQGPITVVHQIILI